MSMSNPRRNNGSILNDRPIVPSFVFILNAPNMMPTRLHIKLTFKALLPSGSNGRQGVQDKIPKITEAAPYFLVAGETFIFPS